MSNVKKHRKHWHQLGGVGGGSRVDVAETLLNLEIACLGTTRRENMTRCP